MKKVEIEWISWGVVVLFFFNRGTFLFSWQKKKPCWHLLFFLSMEAGMDLGSQVWNAQMSDLSETEAIFIIISLSLILFLSYPWLLTRFSVQWFCLSGSQNFSPWKGQVLIKAEVTGCTQEKLLSWQEGSLPCFPLPLNPRSTSSLTISPLPHSQVRQKWDKITRNIYSVFPCKFRSFWFLNSVLPFELPVAFLRCEVLALTHPAFPSGIPRSRRQTFLNYSGQRAQCFVFVFPLSESVKLQTLTVSEIGKHMVCVNCFSQTLLVPISKVSYIDLSGSHMNPGGCASEKEVAYRKDRASWPVLWGMMELLVFCYFF